MVKIERTPKAPESLAVESKKANGSYREPDVVDQLKQDFHNKCYICELNDLTDIEVEHLLPHYGRTRIERVFDWNNLFYSCTHCNSIKNSRKYDEKILDCCKVDPELLLNHIILDGRVSVEPAAGNTDEDVMMTADLIQSCFNKDNTGIRTVQCKARYDRLAKTMNDLYCTLEKYHKDKGSTKYLRALKGMLKREHKFAAFTRHYIRQHLDVYPELQNFVV